MPGRKRRSSPPWPSAPRSSPATCTTRGSARSPAEIAIAHRLGYVVKLLGIIERDADNGDISVRVHPTMVPINHPLASVRDSFNAVFVEGGFVDSLMFYGRGAGGAPTASAVFGDVVDAAVNLRAGTHGSLGTLTHATIRPIDETSAEYLLGLDVADLPGVLHAVTGVFAAHGVSIRVAEQEGNGPDARLVFITHAARESDVQATVASSRDLDVVRSIGGLLPRDRGLNRAVRLDMRNGPGARLQRRSARRPRHRRWSLRARPLAQAGCARDTARRAPGRWGPAALLCRPRGRGDAAVRRTRPRRARPCGGCATEAYSSFRHPAVTPARPARSSAVGAGAVPRPDAGVQGCRAATGRGDVRPRAGRPDHGSRSSVRRAATRAPRRSTASPGCEHVDIVILYPYGRTSQVQRREITTVDQPTSTLSRSRAPSTTARIS